MKRIRNGLLMTLIAVLVLPAPITAATAAPNNIPTVTNAPTEPVSPAANQPISTNKPDPSSVPAGDVSSGGSPPEAATPAPPVASPTPPTASDVAPVTPPQPVPSQPTPSGRLVISKIHLDEPEIIELFNPDATEVNLAGVRIEFTPEGRSPVVLYEFTAGSVAPGDFVTVGDDTPRPFSTGAKNTLSLSGTLRVVLPDAEDEVTFGAQAINVQKKGERFIQRCHHEADEFVVTAFDAGRLGVWPQCQPDPMPTPPVNSCLGLRVSEIGAYTQPQFIELTNGGTDAVQLEGCQLAVDRSTVRHVLPPQLLKPGEIIVISIANTSLTLPKTSGSVSVLSADGKVVDVAVYGKLTKDASWALLDGEWRQTYKPTAGTANIYQQWRDCEPGKQINELTGNCVKISAPVNQPVPCAPGYYRHPETGRCRKESAASAKTATKKSLAPCKEGQYRSEATGRCRSIASAAAKTLKPCKDGYFRSPETGRCRKIAADKDVLKQCAEGYERNPVTKRCRKIRATTAPTVGFSPQAVQEVAGSTWGWWVFGGASLLAAGIGAWYYRWEIGQAARRVAQTFTSGKK